MMVYAQLEDLLKQVTGLESTSIGTGAIERAARARAAACALNARAYLELVRTSTSELQTLIDEIVVPETWFFRDPEAFTALACLANDWLRTHPQGILRLLSLPCSTGEEPYSMAMTLINAGFPADRFCIDAVDISTRALVHAERGVYGNNSFRGADLKFRDGHFDATAQSYRVRDSVRQPVHFQQGNLFAPDFLPGAEIYGIVFCRNLLIYFDRAAQDCTIEVLRRLLTAEGMLFVGPSETALLLSQDFTSAKVPLAFAFRKAPAVAVPRAATPVPAQSIQPPLPRSDVRPSRATPHLSPAHSAMPIAARMAAPPQPLESAPLERALQNAYGLADQGRLAEAALSCEQHLREHGPSAAAFYLMGLIRAAVGNLTEARDYYRKALYLDQNYHDALLHLGLLLERQGDAAGAQVLRNRLRRLDQQSAVK